MSYRVFVPVNPCENDQFNLMAQYAMWWNVHSDYNEGYRATDVLWEWMRNHSIEVYEWHIEFTDEDEPDHQDGATFVFGNRLAALLFKLTWA